jgi:hypothetical protein
MITIPYNKISIVHYWCAKNISPREYYLHTKIGGDGWEISRNKVDWVLTTENPKFETYIELKFI